MPEITEKDVAEKVMGWVQQKDAKAWYSEVDAYGKPTGVNHYIHEQRFLSDIAQAFQVDEKIYNDKGYLLLIHKCPNGKMVASYSDRAGFPITDWMSGNTIAEGICKAAIAAIKEEPCQR